MRRNILLSYIFELFSFMSKIRKEKVNFIDLERIDTRLVRESNEIPPVGHTLLTYQTSELYMNVPIQAI